MSRQEDGVLENCCGVQEFGRWVDRRVEYWRPAVGCMRLAGE